jgi:hypothetical protein
MRVCEGLIIKWQKAHYDEVVRGGKRKNAEADSDKAKRQRKVGVERSESRRTL